MEAIKLNATLIEKVSTKSGEPYKCVEIELTPTYKMTAFLSKAELELVNSQHRNNDIESLDNIPSFMR